MESGAGVGAAVGAAVDDSAESASLRFPVAAGSISSCQGRRAKRCDAGSWRARPRSHEGSNARPISYQPKPPGHRKSGTCFVKIRFSMLHAVNAPVTCQRTLLRGWSSRRHVCCRMSPSPSCIPYTACNCCHQSSWQRRSQLPKRPALLNSLRVGVAAAGLHPHPRPPTAAVSRAATASVPSGGGSPAARRAGRLQGACAPPPRRP